MGKRVGDALDEYLAACIVEASTAKGPILERGSGLSTLIVGEIARRRGLSHWALEHTTQWAAKVIACLERYGIDRKTLCASEPFAIMATSPGMTRRSRRCRQASRWSSATGLSGTTRRGRYGLVPIMRGRLAPGFVVLLDDAGRKEERSIAKRWQEELGATFEMAGRAKPYIRMIR